MTAGCFTARTNVNLCLIAASAMLFNVYPERVGLLKSVTVPSSFTPLLAPEFHTYLPWLNLWWGLTFSLNLAHLLTLVAPCLALAKSSDVASC